MRNVNKIAMYRFENNESDPNIIPNIYTENICIIESISKELSGLYTSLISLSIPSYRE